MPYCTVNGYENTLGLDAALINLTFDEKGSILDCIFPIKRQNQNYNAVKL